MCCDLMSLTLITASQIRSGLALVPDVSMAMKCVVRQAATALGKRYSNGDVSHMCRDCFIITQTEKGRRYKAAFFSD